MTTLRDPACHDDLLNYRLKQIVNVGGAAAIRLCEGRYGISRFQWRTLAALAESGPMSPAALVRRTGVDGARISLAIRALADKGLVHRESVSGDRRRALVFATVRGSRLYEELFPQLASLNRALVAALDAAEERALDRCLHKLLDRARKLAESGAGVPQRAQRRLGTARRLSASLDSKRT
ncbi:MAG TPA: MarR family transcriptional regulator [Casimicrobiaceae bacterium]|nr:MarR family transcriptional regulator [Casimicrobiaceae bacterium]